MDVHVLTEFVKHGRPGFKRISKTWTSRFSKFEKDGCPGFQKMGVHVTWTIIVKYGLLKHGRYE